MREYQLPAGDAEVFRSNVELGSFFEKAVGYQKTCSKSPNPKAIANWVINNLSAKLAEKGQSPSAVDFLHIYIPELVELVEAKTISSSAAQQVFAEMFDTGKAPAVIVQEKGLAQVSDTGAIEKFCDEAIAANPNPVADYKAGKIAALNSLKGQVMKLSKGKANPALVGEILERKLKS